MESVFNKFDDEEADEQPRKRKLVPLDYGDDDKSLGLDGAEISGAKGSINTEEKRKHIKSLIEKIPTLLLPSGLDYGRLGKKPLAVLTLYIL